MCAKGMDLYRRAATSCSGRPPEVDRLGATWTAISPGLWVGRGYPWPDAVAVDAGPPSTVYMVVTANAPLGGDS